MYTCSNNLSLPASVFFFFRSPYSNLSLVAPKGFNEEFPVRISNTFLDMLLLVLEQTSILHESSLRLLS